MDDGRLIAQEARHYGPWAMIGTPSHIALAMMSIGSVHIHAHFIGRS
ncbi:hypothetical protein O4G76_07615 [Limimaricola sp. G21655-S1]|nr:hypothetical protein [Limimaricola sp. G21655-S1]MCZ4260706.1 hypothetical protein [Limimaricola sp. G21655-S1]